MRILLLAALVATAGCEDDRRASRRDRYDDDSVSYGGLGASASAARRRAQQDRDDMLRKMDDDLLQLKKQVAPQATGAWECDELVRLTTCLYDKYGTAVPDAAKQAFADGVSAWRDALANYATREATIEACKLSLDAGKSGFDASGCY